MMDRCGEYSIKDLNRLAIAKQDLGHSLLAKLSDLSSIEGSSKLQRKILKEIKFLQKVTASGKLNPSHVLCSNLTHYDFLVRVLFHQKDVTELDRAIYSKSQPNPNIPIRIDIVCENGKKWIKVIARKATSLREVVLGQSSYGAKSVLDQAKEYSSAAKENLHMFSPPVVVFQFSDVIDDKLKSKLEEIGIRVSIGVTQSEPEHLKSNSNVVTNLNLDITAMLAYVSNLTNGNNCWLFNEPILNQQALWEERNPVKVVLDNQFEGKQLICCETASKSFQEIILLIGGPNEKKRANELMHRIKIFEDVEFIPKELSGIEAKGKIKPRSLKIFAFGVARRSITITSNEGFIRSSKMKGVVIPVFIIEARALTELKESSAKRMLSPRNDPLYPTTIES